MAKFTLEFGGMKLRISERSLVAVHPDFSDGRHLTINWQPQETGRHTGFYTPHVTFPKRQQRRTLGRSSPADLTLFFQQMTNEMVMFWAGASRLTTTEALTQEGWFVLGFDEVVEARMRELYLVDPDHFRLPVDERDRIDFFLLMLERGVEPAELRVGADTRQPRYLVRQHDEMLEGAMLCHYQNGFFGPPGWYVVTQKDIANQMFHVTFMRHARPTAHSSASQSQQVLRRRASAGLD
jgi:hypothetical protein